MSAAGATGDARLVGDVGGTSIRLAWQPARGGSLAHAWRGRWRDGADLADTIEGYLREHALPAPARVALGVAGPVTGDRVALTNRADAFSQADLRERLGARELLVVNDYVALAHGLAAIGPGDARVVGPLDLHRLRFDAPRLVLGPGTGLGVAALVPAPDRPDGHAVAVGGEGGHVTLAANDAFEDAVLQRLRARFGRVSAERVLSGEGLENLARAIAEVQGGTVPDLTDADITARGLAGDAFAGRVLDLFLGFLGHVAGDFALAFGARGGVCIGGGIVPRLGDAIDRSRFRACFEAKGRHAGWMAAVPTAVLGDAAGLALRGAAAALDA